MRLASGDVPGAPGRINLVSAGKAEVNPVEHQGGCGPLSGQPDQAFLDHARRGMPAVLEQRRAPAESF